MRDDDEDGTLERIRGVLEDVQSLNIEILSKTTRSGRKRIDSSASSSGSSSSAAAAAAASGGATAPAAASALPPTEGDADGLVKSSWGRVKKWQKVLPFLSKRAQAASVQLPHALQREWRLLCMHACLTVRF